MDIESFAYAFQAVERAGGPGAPAGSAGLDHTRELYEELGLHERVRAYLYSEVAGTSRERVDQERFGVFMLGIVVALLAAGAYDRRPSGPSHGCP
jgi:hypothetical protein